MKTKLIALMISGVVVFGSFSFVYALMYDCLNPPMWMKIPRFDLRYCWGLFLNGHLPDWSQAREDYAKKQAHKMTLLERYQNMPEVVAFYDKYDDANVSVRDDHLSYFAGHEDEIVIRMNLYFDENNELEHLNFHCYHQREHQVEVAQEDIVSFLENNDCKKYGT